MQVRGDNVDDPTTYLVSFDDAEARYVVFICLASLYNPSALMYACKTFPWFRYLLHHLFKFQLQPLPTKLVLRKKRAKEGRSTDEVEHFPAPSRVTVRRRPTVATLEVKDPGV